MTTDPLYLALLVGSAFCAGALNSVAGGGTLLTFPALMNFGGLSAPAANATSTVALVTGSLAGAWGYRRDLRGTGPWLWLLLVPSLVGGAAGSLLVTRLPESAFALLVPWLLLSAALLFWAQPTLLRLFPPRATGLPGWPIRSGLVLFQLLVALYGGFFGAGIGILMLSSLGLMGIGDIHRMNAVKTLLAAAINAVSVVVFAADGLVRWDAALILGVGAVAGGFAGARVGQRLPRRVVRWFVILLGLALAAYYFAHSAG